MSTGSLTSFNDIVQIRPTNSIGNEIGDRVRNLLSHHRYARGKLNEMGDLVSELVDNFAQHSEASHAACVLQRYPEIGRTDFVIGDCGIGIRQSLSQNKDYEHLNRLSHREAAGMAFRMSASRRAEGGMGLPEVAESVDALGGQLFLATGDGWLLFQHGELPSFGDQLCNLPGVQVEVSIPDGG